MEFVAGIDGGGTKTTLLCWSTKGDKKKKKTFGAFNINSIGEDAFKLLLNEISAELSSLGKCLHLVIGAAGISNNRMSAIADEVFSGFNIPYTLVGDHVIALEGAHEGKEGLAVIAGTGSICFGKGSDGTIERTGGWGHIIGDEGSAYALGRDSLKAIAEDIDGCGGKTVLRALVSARHGLETREDIIRFVYNGDKADIASIAPCVDIAYRDGDDVAIKIVRENAMLLAYQMQAVLKKLDLKHAYAAFFGGLIDKDTPFRMELIKALEDINAGIEYRKPMHNAATGAVMLALKKSKEMTT